MTEYTEYIVIDPKLAQSIETTLHSQQFKDLEHHHYLLNRTVRFVGTRVLAWIGVTGFKHEDGSCRPKVKMILYEFDESFENPVAVWDSEPRDEFYGEWGVIYDGNTFKVIVERTDTILDSDVLDATVIHPVVKAIARDIRMSDNLDRVYQLANQLEELMEGADADDWIALFRKYYPDMEY